MDSGASSASGIGKIKTADKTRRSWTAHEEECLLQSLKEACLKGWKSENGFKAGYLTFLENAMQKALPGCELCGNPHINSKIHVWKKNYGSLVSILSRSGVGWNDSNHNVDANDETWESIIKSDPSMNTMRYKHWTMYDDWCQIFGNERATGDSWKTFRHAVNDVLQLETELDVNLSSPDVPIISQWQAVGDDSVSDTNTPLYKPVTGAASKSKKRKWSNDDDDSVVVAINNLAHITKDTLGELIKELAAEEKISATQDKVLEALNGLHEFTKGRRVRAVQAAVQQSRRPCTFSATR